MAALAAIPFIAEGLLDIIGIEGLGSVAATVLEGGTAAEIAGSVATLGTEALIGAESAETVATLTTLGIEGLTVTTEGELAFTTLEAAEIGASISSTGEIQALENSLTGLSAPEILAELPEGSVPPGQIGAIDMGEEITPLGSGQIENIQEDIFGQSIEIDDTPEILGLDVLDLTQTGFMDLLENQLADIGITKDMLGETGWNHLVLLVAGGSLTADEVVKFFEENKLQETIGNQIDDLIRAKTGIGNPNAYIYIDSLGNPVNLVDVLNGNIKDVLDPYYIGYSTGKLVCSTAWEYSTVKGRDKRNRPDKEFLFATLRAVHKNDEYAYIARRMNEYMQDAEYIKDPKAFSTKYNYYYQIYNGKYQQEPHYEDDGFVHARDETGKEFIYDGPKGKQKFLGVEVRNPTLHGVYVGPLSPNDALPIDNFDGAAYFHDCDYQEGWFRKNADLKLVSRVNHILNDPEQLSKYDNLTIYKMKFTSWWFSYPGVFLASLVDQGLSDDTHKNELYANEGSFFDQIMGTYDKTDQQNSLNLPDEYYFLRIKARSFAEINFWKGVREAVDQSYKYYSEIYMKESAKDSLDAIKIYN